MEETGKVDMINEQTKSGDVGSDEIFSAKEQQSSDQNTHSMSVNASTATSAADIEMMNIINYKSPGVENSDYKSEMEHVNSQGEPFNNLDNLDDLYHVENNTTTATITAAAATTTTTNNVEAEISMPSSPSSSLHPCPTPLAASTQDPPCLLSDQRYPSPLYCPLTHQLFQDPVVAPDGHSYERDVILQLDAVTTDQVYPNRALQQILDEGPKNSLLEQLWELSLWPPEKPLSDAYYCPITFDLMHVPVIDPEGNTYEQAAIVHWIHANGHSPISRKPLSVVELYPNHVIRQLLEFYANDKPNHPALSTWKSEPPPSVPESTDPPLYPTTYEELEAHRNHMRRQRQKMVACTVVGVVCLLLAIVAAILYGGYCIFVSIWIGCCVRDAFQRLRQLQYQQREDQRVFQETQQRVDALQERLEQFNNSAIGQRGENAYEQGLQTLETLEQRLEQIRGQQLQQVNPESSLDLESNPNPNPTASMSHSIQMWEDEPITSVNSNACMYASEQSAR